MSRLPGDLFYPPRSATPRPRTPRCLLPAPVQVALLACCQRLGQLLPTLHLYTDIEQVQITVVVRLVPRMLSFVTLLLSNCAAPWRQRGEVE